jgi:hypothetical protein
MNIKIFSLPTPDLSKCIQNSGASQFAIMITIIILHTLIPNKVGTMEGHFNKELSDNHIETNQCDQKFKLVENELCKQSSHEKIIHLEPFNHEINPANKDKEISEATCTLINKTKLVNSSSLRKM